MSEVRGALETGFQPWVIVELVWRELCASEGKNSWSAWVAQLGKHLTLDFGSGHDLTVCGFNP